MQSVTAAAASVGYSRDYVTKLARDQKIIAIQNGRQWFVDLQSLEEYAEKSLTEQKLRQHELSEQRKAEREKALAMAEAEKIPTPYFKRVAQQKSSVAMLALLGLASTYSFLHFSLLTSSVAGIQAASSAVIPEFQNAESAYEIAVGTSVSATEPPVQQIDFTQESMRLADMENFQDGILLLPVASGTKPVAPESLFSDKVEIFTDEQGQTFVGRVDDKNQVVSKIPFVVVPVDANQVSP